jgi:peptidoglycan/xylan/chitin deacetylase (PgdA/CDA1 family)
VSLAVRVGRGAAYAPPVSAGFRVATRRQLRILAYHDVPDLEALDRQLTLLRRRGFVPVSGREVAAADRSGLRAGATWITFDDGFAGALGAAELLAAHGVSATAFLCPSVVDTDEPYWWHVADAWQQLQGAGSGSLVTTLKALPDPVRRAAVAQLRSDLVAAGRLPHVGQATSELVDAWLAAGHELGNHTWDHPVLDACPEEEQERQVVAAHDWLVARGWSGPRVFAYPNGNSTPFVRDLLARLGYDPALLFDMRLDRGRPDATERSRLRVDASDDLPRFEAALSGSLATLAHVGRRVSTSGPGRTR